jgi:hypothetical protein
MATVAINPPRTPVTQGSNGIAAAIPNVCKMPGPPAPFIPVPLPNIGMSGSSPESYSTTVTIESNSVAIRGASFGSVGDVASQPTGGGLISSVTQGRTMFVGPGALDVKIEGRNVQLLGDPMLNNGAPGGSPANAATMAGVLQASLSLLPAATGTAAAAPPPPMEIRRIVLAQGKQFQNVNLPLLHRVPEILMLSGADRLAEIENQIKIVKSSTLSETEKQNSIAFWQKHMVMRNHQKLDIKKTAPNTYIYESAIQNVRYELKITTKKKEFIIALLTKDIHVIYAGHARYGRGPCFGDNGAAPGEDWEEGFGSHPNDTGLFRMGRPFIGVPSTELFEHGYRANLVSAAHKLTDADCDFDGMHITKYSLNNQMRKGTLSDIQHAIPDSVRGKHLKDCPACNKESMLLLKNHVKNTNPDAKWWYYMAKDKGIFQPHFVLHAGWQKTTSSPDDLGANELQCRAFCHFGCSTEHHNQEIISKLAKWELVNDNHYAFFTNNLAYGLTAALWLQHLFTYDNNSAGQPWKGSLDYAKSKINADLIKGGWGYRIV